MGLGALTLSANAIIDFNAPGSTSTAGGSILFFDSLTNTGDLPFITIAHWTGGMGGGNDVMNVDRLLFATDPGMTESQLRTVQWTNDAGVLFATGARQVNFDGYYEIAPVPEPTTVLSAIGLLGFIGFRERRRVCLLLQRVLPRV